MPFTAQPKCPFSVLQSPWLGQGQLGVSASERADGAVGTSGEGRDSHGEGRDPWPGLHHNHHGEKSQELRASVSPE